MLVNVPLAVGVPGVALFTPPASVTAPVLVPLTLRFVREHPGITLDLSFDDRYVNLVEQGIDVAVRGELIEALKR